MSSVDFHRHILPDPAAVGKNVPVNNVYPIVLSKLTAAGSNERTNERKKKRVDYPAAVSQAAG